MSHKDRCKERIGPEDDDRCRREAGHEGMHNAVSGRTMSDWGNVTRAQLLWLSDRATHDTERGR